MSTPHARNASSNADKSVLPTPTPVTRGIFMAVSFHPARPPRRCTFAPRSMATPDRGLAVPADCQPGFANSMKKTHRFGRPVGPRVTGRYPRNVRYQCGIDPHRYRQPRWRLAEVRDCRLALVLLLIAPRRAARRGRGMIRCHSERARFGDAVEGWEEDTRGCERQAPPQWQVSRARSAVLPG